MREQAEVALSRVGVDPSISANVVWGKDKLAWVHLNPREQSSAAVLGYHAASWDRGVTPECCKQLWCKLSSPEQASALMLGYEEHGYSHPYQTRSNKLRRGLAYFLVPCPIEVDYEYRVL